MKNMYEYSKAIAPTVDLPFGAFKNESEQGKNDGTLILAEQKQDLYYALYSILQLAGVSPNGKLENGSDSKQFLAALSNITFLKHNDHTAYIYGHIAHDIINGTMTFYRSLKGDNSDNLSNPDSWLPILSIDPSGKLNFLSGANIESSNELLYELFSNTTLPDITNGEIYYTIIEDKNLENESVSATQLKQEILTEVDNKLINLLQQNTITNL